MMRTHLLTALFSLLSLYSHLHAQAFGLKTQYSYNNLKINSGTSFTTDGFSRSLCGGFFIEERFNAHDAAGVELTGTQIKYKVSNQGIYTAFNPDGGIPTTLTYTLTNTKKIGFLNLNGYYRHIRGRWALKGGMQMLVPLIEINKIKYTGTSFFEDSSDAEIGPEYLKMGLTTGLEFAIDSQLRLGIDYCKEIRHFTTQRSLPYYDLQIFSAGIKISFVKSKYKFT